MSMNDTPEQGTGGPSMGRRVMLKGVGAAATTAAVGGASVGTAAAQSGDANYDTLAKSGVDWAFRNEEKAKMAGMILSGGALAPAILGGDLAADGEISFGQKAADWLGGQWDKVDDGDAQQMELSSYYHLKDMRDSHMMLLEQLANQAELIVNNATSAGVFEISQGIQAGDRQSTALSEGQTDALDMIARIERDIIKVLESLLMRTVNLRDRQAIVFGDRPDYDVTIQYYNSDTGAMAPNLWTSKMEYTLMNGDVIETRVLRAGLGESNDYQSVAAHPLLNSVRVAGINNDTLASRTDRYDEWESDSDVKIDHQLFNNIDNADEHESQVVVQPPDTASDGPVEPFRIPSELGGMSDNVGIQLWFNDGIRARGATISDELATIAEDAYSAYNSGDLQAAKDLLTPFVRSQNLAMEWQDTGHFGVGSAFAQNLGYSTSLKAEMDVTIFTPDGTDSNGDTIYTSEQKTGNLLADDDAWAEQVAAGDDTMTVEDAKPIEFSEGERRPVPAGSDMGVATYLSTGDGLMPIDQDGQEIRVDRILDADGKEKSSVSTSSTDLNDVDISDLEDRLAERLDSQQELTVDIQGGGGGGDGSGGGFLGLSDKQLAGGAAGAGIVAYLMGKGGGKAVSLHPGTR